MRWFPFALLTLFGALLEAGNLLNLIAVGDWHIRPAVLVVLLVFFAMHCRTHEAILASFILGLAMDLTGRLMGPHTISFCLAGGLLHQLSEYYPMRRFFQQATVIFAAYLVTEVLAYWLGAIRTGERQDHVYQAAAFTALYSACVGPVVWRLVRRVNRLADFKPPRFKGGYLR